MIQIFINIWAQVIRSYPGDNINDDDNGDNNNNNNIIINNNSLQHA
jgi:hypothetical protein